MNFEISKMRCEIDKKEKWVDWAHKIPYLQFPDLWLVKAVPPFTGALVRYFITSKKLADNNIKKFVSVYLDCFQSLGCAKDYWEIYPYDDDVCRYDIYDTEGLLGGIGYCLENFEKEIRK